MRVILAGGTGFLGRTLAQALLDSGDQVWVLSRNPERANLPGRVEILVWDARTPKGWEKPLEEADAVVNLVGENIGGGRWTAERKARIRNSRVNAGRAISAGIEQANHRPAVLLQASGIGYYGFTGDRMVNESSPNGSDFLARVCQDWEDSTRSVEELGVRRVITRNALVLDPREGVFPTVLLPFRLMVGGPVGSGRQWFPWIHRDDEIQAMLYLLKNESASGPYNFNAPDMVTYSQLGRAVAKAAHRPYWAPAPGFVLKAVLGEMSTLVLEGQHAAPERLLQAGYKFRFPKLEGALKDLLG